MQQGLADNLANSLVGSFFDLLARTRSRSITFLPGYDCMEVVLPLAYWAFGFRVHDPLHRRNCPRAWEILPISGSTDNAMARHNQLLVVFVASDSSWSDQVWYGEVRGRGTGRRRGTIGPDFVRRASQPCYRAHQSTAIRAKADTSAAATLATRLRD